MLRAHPALDRQHPEGPLQRLHDERVLGSRLDVLLSNRLTTESGPDSLCCARKTAAPHRRASFARAFSGAGAGAGGVLTERRVKVRGLEKYKVRLALAGAADVPVWQCAPVEALDSVLAKNVILFCARRLYGFCLFYPP